MIRGVRGTQATNRIYNDVNQRKKRQRDPEGKGEYQKKQDEAMENIRKAGKLDGQDKIRVPADYRQSVGYTYNRIRINEHAQSQGIQTYDFLDRENIATVCFNFILYLHLYDKHYKDDDSFVLSARAEFFGQYGEKIVHLTCDGREKDGMLDLDDIIDVKQDVFHMLNNYMDFASRHVDALTRYFAREWRDFEDREKSKDTDLKEIKVVSIQENFFTMALYQLYEASQKYKKDE